MIHIDEKNGIFSLHTPNTSYVMAVVDGQYLCHLYYGARISDDDVLYLGRFREQPYTPSVNPGEKISFYGRGRFEYPCFGTGDFREACLKVRNSAGQCGTELLYRSYRLYEGKIPLPSLPTSFGTSCKTLEILLEDPLSGLKVVLSYSVFDDLDVITRSVQITNTGEADCYLERALSACLELDDSAWHRGDAGGHKTKGGSYEVLTLGGAWAREHILQRQILGGMAVCAETLRGEAGHETQPFIALVGEDTSWVTGEVYAMHFVYSGNFLAKAARDAYGQIRMVIGIHPETFTWKLEKGECFTTPETVLTYSCMGLEEMTRTLHRFYRKHMIRSPWQYRSRPVLLNSWEACYFDFDTEKLLKLADQAHDLGIEMLVVDDGWFGEHRESPHDSLGDWFVNERKIEGGLKVLRNRLDTYGMRLGLWFEPEMISPSSLLYREHPDWVLQLSDREAGLCRNQWVLDFSNPDVTQELFRRMSAIIRECRIDYIKWDMNRPLADAGSGYLPADRQKEVWHRHVLGLYHLQEKLLEAFPDLLLENCSSGGARFDPGMLYYSPQIWCSDDMDPMVRTGIHEGTALLYPLSCIGSHVCKEKNDITGRVTPFETRALSAMTGTFGYELNICMLTEEEKRKIPGQIRLYRQMEPLLQRGDYYRLSSVSQTDGLDIFEVMDSEKGAGYVMITQVLAVANGVSVRIRLRGLKEDALYEVRGRGIAGNGEHEPLGSVNIWGEADGADAGKEGHVRLHGDTLMRAGYIVCLPKQDFVTVLHRINQED